MQRLTKTCTAEDGKKTSPGVKNLNFCNMQMAGLEFGTGNILLAHIRPLKTN